MEKYKITRITKLYDTPEYTDLPEIGQQQKFYSVIYTRRAVRQYDNVF